ncbi:MAG: NDP-sugar synthase, partial [Actinomycetota bacterium]|nr:NDP-sugar synthase [Actinomycetota bacterium]
PVLDVPLAAWALADLRALDVPVVVNTGRGGDVVQAALAPYANGSVEFMSELPEPPGSGGTIANLRDRAEVIVARNADHLIRGLDLGALVEQHRASGAAMTIVVRPVPERADVTIEGGHAGRLVDRRVEPGTPGGLWVGTSVISTDQLPDIPPRRPIDLTAAVLAPLILQERVAVHLHRGYELDVGTPARYLRACIDFLWGRGPEPPRPFGGRFLEAAGARAYVGDGAQVDDSSIGGDAVVLAGAHVPERAYVGRALVMPGEKVPTDEDVVDAIFFDGKVVPL